MSKFKTQFIASLIVTVIVALCCFTPILVILLGVLGLGALVGYLDYVLIPALGILVALTLYSYARYQKSSLKNRRKIMSENCCSETQKQELVTCPINNQKGKRVKTITLESLLTPEALLFLNNDSNYFFCEDKNCPVVYFNRDSHIFIVSQLKIPVFQKDKGGEVPVCYCFNWTRNGIFQKIEKTHKSTAEASIVEQVKAQKCACEINNPQGSCCLGNIRHLVKTYSITEK